MTTTPNPDPDRDALSRLVRIMLTLGALAVLSAVPSIHARPTWAVLAGCVAFLVGDTALFHIRFGHNQQSFTWAETAVVVGLVVVPSPWLRLAAPLGVALAHLARRRPLVKVGFNAATAATGVLLARSVFVALGGSHSAVGEPQVWRALATAGMAYWAWNGIAVSLAVALSQGLTWWPVYRKGLLLNVLVAAGNTTTGILLVVVASVNPWALVCVPVLCFLLLIAYHGYIKAMRERDTWEVLQDVSTNLLQVDELELAHVVIEGSRRLFGAEFVELLVADGEPGTTVARFRRSDAEGIVRTAGSPFTVAAPFWGRVLADREPFQVRARSATALQREELVELGLASCAVAPLLGTSGVAGCLRVGFRSMVKLGLREVQVLTTFANHVSAAVSNARHFDEMRVLALHDALTGLPNRTLLLDRLDQALARSQRSGSSVAVLFLDLDRFKVINDSLGHEAGDDLLIAVARRLALNLRPGDTATRFGGDEFVIVCEDVADQVEAMRLANRLVEVFEQPFELASGREVFMSASFGVVVSESGFEEPGALLGHADTAMYRAKERGRNCCEVFDDALSARAVTRLEREGELRHAIEGRELLIHYQPTVRLSDQRIVGAEALLRWQHPTHGFLPPAEFIPLAEETGLICPIGVWVIEQAVGAIAANDMPIAVNLSPRQLADPGLVPSIVAALEREQVAPGMLGLEITESALVDDTDTTQDTLRELHALGMRIALDDFGTGYSSLSYLRHLPVDVLKIDRSFIDHLGHDDRDLAIVSGIVELAHALGVTVVAEGVETARQLAAVQEAGCDVAQGYYFARPQPMPELVALATLRPFISLDG